MIAPLAKFLDWSAIQYVALMMPANTFTRNPRLEEAAQFLQGPDFIPVESQPAQVEFNGPLDFRFPTPRRCGVMENDVVYGRLYRCQERWQERPAIILLHGWGDFFNYGFRFPWIARRFNRAGFSAATLVAPYHFQRRPRQRGAYASGDWLLGAESVAQAISEIRAMTGWLLKEGCPDVALWGISMGAWHAGVAVCRDARLGAVVLDAPCGRFNPWVQQRAVLPRIRARLQNGREACDRMNCTALNPTTSQPAISREKILLIEGIYDLICWRDAVEDLWQTWGQPEIWRLPDGHVGVCCGFVPGLSGRVIDWLTPRLNGDRVRTLNK